MCGQRHHASHIGRVHPHIVGRRSHACRTAAHRRSQVDRIAELVNAVERALNTGLVFAVVVVIAIIAIVVYTETRKVSR